MPGNQLWDQVMWGEMVNDQQHGLPCATGKCPKKEAAAVAQQPTDTTDHPANPLNEIIVWDAVDWL